MPEQATAGYPLPVRSERRREGRFLPEHPFRRSDCERLQRRPPARNQHWADAVTRPQRVLNFAVWISAAITAALGILQTITGDRVAYIGLINLAVAAVLLTIPWLNRFGNVIAPVAFVVIAYSSLTFVGSQIGTDSGVQFYYLVSASLAVLVLGIDYESLKKINPRVILASISGFGQDGPYQSRPGFDQIAQGLSGIMSVTGAAGAGPMRVGCAVADVGAGLLAALGVMTALVERERSGEGQWVQSNLLQAGIQLLDFQAARFTMSGEVPRQVGNDHPTSMPTSAYKTADGYINVAAAGSAMWQRVCEAIGRKDLYDNPDFKRAEDRARNRAGLNTEITKALAGKTSAEWVETLNQAGIPCGPIYAMNEVFADPQVRHVQASAPVHHPTLGTLNLINNPIKLSRTPPKLATATPERGAHTAEVLQEAGYSAAEIETFRKQGVV